MPTLKDHKQEAFCQFIAQGKSQDESYRLAGYKPHRANAHRLRTNERISARIEALQHQTMVEFEITAEQITKQLDEDRAFAYECENPSAAVAATVAKAKLAGLMVDKGQINVSHVYSTMSEEEIRFELAAIAAEARALKPGVQN